jgi:HD-GYP domain-containing protein (c-di-GMP phosphodiesterase class II)
MDSDRPAAGETLPRQVEITDAGSIRDRALAAEPRLVVYGVGALDPSAEAVVRGEGMTLPEPPDWHPAADAPALWIVGARDLTSGGALAEDLSSIPPHLTLVPAGPAAEAAVGRHPSHFLPLPEGDASAQLRLLRAAFRHSAARLGAARAERELERARREMQELNRVGMALMTERDPDRLLQLIVERSRWITRSDAGSLYLAERDGAGEDARTHLRFKLAQNDSLPGLPFTEFTLPLDRTSLAGYVGVTLEPLALEDAYDLPEDAPYSFNRSFDERSGYRTRSLLIVPLLDRRGALVGVLQLINRKRSPEAAITSVEEADASVTAYGEREMQLAQSLAGQAAVSIENARLYRDIEQLFESFVKASVTAIDQRDPTTAGHSVRVAALTVDMAHALTRFPRGPFANLRLSSEQLRELRYAALLHDFGKVAVREEVLVKARKLPPRLGERVGARFALIRATLEAEFQRRRAEHFLELRGGDAGHLRVLEAEFEDRREELRRYEEAVMAANEPTVLPAEAASILQEIAARGVRGVQGEEIPFLTEEEHRFLSIPRGSLDAAERLEIESHVEQTYRFLSQIPWTEDLRNVSAIAYGHHEKLDGRGYPRRVSAEEIPVQTRLMTVADIFDALTASDRPYKRALPPEKAIDILRMEAREGMLDGSLVEMLVESGVYRRILEVDWREL